MPPILEVLRRVDATFEAMPNVSDPFVSTRYRNKQRFVVDVLVPNRGSDAYQAKPARMKALGDSGAQPLRHLDYLITAVRSFHVKARLSWADGPGLGGGSGLPRSATERQCMRLALTRRAKARGLVMRV